MISLWRRFLRTTRLFSTDIWAPKKPKNLLRRYFVFTSAYEGRALEQVWSVCSLFSVSKPPRSPQHCTGGGSWPETWMGFDLFLRTFQMWTLPRWKPLLPVAFDKTFWAPKIQNLSLQKYLGNALFWGLLPTRAVFAPAQLSVLSHRATHESHRILVMAFKPCIVGCLWRSCICFRDLF